MNGRIVIWLGLLAVALAIVRITAEATPGAVPKQRINCYVYSCGIGGSYLKDLELCPKNITILSTVLCDIGVKRCTHDKIKGKSGTQDVDFVMAKCDNSNHQTDECEDGSDETKPAGFTGTGERCYCSTDLCNDQGGPTSHGFLITASFAFVTFAVIAVKIEIF